MTTPEPLIAPGNDYRSAMDRHPCEDVTATVIVPVYNRGVLLDNVLAGLATQTVSGFAVIVADDGSEEAIDEVVDRYDDRLDIRLVRQERDGFGLARVRNLAAAEVATDIAAFLDGDCIPASSWVERHLSWHRRASNLVVTGSRRHIDVLVAPEQIASGAIDLSAAAADDRADGDLRPDDWRKLVYRRSQRLLLGDGAYRAPIGGNTSLSIELFREVGGASELFRAWGGEDTDLGWRLWNAGAFIVPEDGAMIYHQRFLDAPDAARDRTEARSLALPLMADRIPHPFYRKEVSHLHGVPTVTWIATVASRDEADRAWREASLATYTDTELILVGPADAVAAWSAVARPTSRVRVAVGFPEAVRAAAGAVVAIVDGRVRVDRRLLARAMRRFEDRDTTVVRVGYRAEGGRVLRLDDMASLDAVHGRDGLPFFALVKRRELMKDRAALDRPAEAWGGAVARGSAALLVTDLVPLPPDVDATARRPRLTDARAAGIEELARGARRAARPGAPGAMSSDGNDRGTEDRVDVAYIGLAGHGNLGDDAMLLAIQRLMPWANVAEGVGDPRLVMLGGGTLLNSGGYYLNKVRRVDGPNRDRVVFGTGVKAEDYWGFTESIGDWEPFLTSALGVGVRGPDSVATLRAWGYRGPVEVIGDPALAIERPPSIESGDGVIICPMHSGGDCWGSDDAAVLRSTADLIIQLCATGRRVTLMTAHPDDDRWAIEVMRAAGRPDLEYLAGHADVDAAIEAIAGSALVVGERLHAIVLAAAVGTAFVGIEYRPKLRDFARSIDADRWLVRTDHLEPLPTLVAERLAEPVEFDPHVGMLRGRLVAFAERLEAEFTDR